MTAELLAIKTAYEEEEMSVDEISETRGLELAAVKSALMQCSSVYRRACRKESEGEDTLNYSRDEQQRIKDALLNLALGADDQNLQFKVLVYCNNEAKGRNDVVKATAQQNINVLMINEQLKKVRSIADRIPENIGLIPSSRVVEVNGK